MIKFNAEKTGFYTLVLKNNSGKDSDFQFSSAYAERNVKDCTRRSLYIAVFGLLIASIGVIKDKIKRPFIGIMPRGDTIKQRFGFFEAGDKALKQSIFITVLTVKAIYKMITRKIEPEVAGPIGVIHITYKVAKTGFINLLSLIALININLFLINLIPLLPLDGGLILIFLIEGVTGKKVSIRVQEALMEIGWTLIIFLIIFATYNDILRFFKR